MATDDRGSADRQEAKASLPVLRLPCAPLVTLRPMEYPPTLSVRLRDQTAHLHRQTEELLGLPGAIRTRNDYCLWLGRFLGLYEPLEHALAGFSEWSNFGMERPSFRHSISISDDLAALGVDPAGMLRCSRAMLAHLPTFAHAVGALYVLEGSTLGGRFILRDIRARIGDQIAGATLFFGGRGDEVGAIWRRFGSALDAFGTQQPLLQSEVVTGAERVFGAILAWFASFCTVAGVPR